MVICIVPLSEGTNSLDTPKEIKINSNNKGIPEISVASETIKVKAASKRKVKRKVVKKKVVKKTVKKVKAVYRYKVKVRYFYKGKWRYKWVYRYYKPTVKAVVAPAPVIRDVPYWECYGPTANCQSDDPRIIERMKNITVPVNATIQNPEPQPPLPTPVDSPGSKPQRSDYINETAYNAYHLAWVNSEPQESEYLDITAYNADHLAWVNSEPQENNYFNETAYNTALTAWESKNTAYQNYLIAKQKYDQYQPTITVETRATYENAVSIFNYARDVEYTYYFNTARGAVGTMNDLHGNCCDITHLLIALSRAAGIPARYIHADCTFLSGSRCGHVWAQVWVNGQWYTADASNDINDFGVIRNWNTGTMYLKGIFSSLLF